MSKFPASSIAWQEDEYIYVDGKRHIYTKTKDVFLVHFPGGYSMPLHAIGDRVVKMPKRMRDSAPTKTSHPRTVIISHDDIF